MCMAFQLSFAVNQADPATDSDWEALWFRAMLSEPSFLHLPPQLHERLDDQFVQQRSQGMAHES